MTRIRRYGSVRTVSADDRTVLDTITPDRLGDWSDLVEGTVITVEVEDTETELVRDMAQWRGNLQDEAVAQLRELRPRLLEFLDRAVSLEDRA